MIPWIIQTSIISLLLIFLLHYLFMFFKDNLTVPKTIDLVNKPKEQYEEFLKTNGIKKEKPTTNESNNSMKDELKNYLRDLKNTTSIEEIGSSSTQMYSSY